MEELERTYLAKELPPNLAACRSKSMLDIYVPSTSSHPIVRIRKRGDVYEITKKAPIVEGDASRSMEETIPLTLEEYRELSAIPGKRISKNRYYYTDGGIDFEIDVFQDDLEGLVLVDVEFPSVEQKDTFREPGFCLTEVTQQEFLAGGMLCGKKYADIEPELQRLGYKKLSL